MNIDAELILSQANKLFEKHKVFFTGNPEYTRFNGVSEQIQSEIDAIFPIDKLDNKELFKVELEKCRKYQKEQTDCWEHRIKQTSEIAKLFFTFTITIIFILSYKAIEIDGN
jgi:hypothetical protein